MIYGLDVVAQGYNLSYFGDIDWEDHNSRPAQQINDWVWWWVPVHG
jgi:hypothetical protein